MTKVEFAKFISAIKAYYQRDDLFKTSEIARLWYAELEDMGYEEAVTALRRYVQTNRFPPTIADIRSTAADNKSASDGWSKGWESMRNAVRRYGYMQECEAMDSLDPLTREVTRRLGWKEICESDASNEQALRANFRMIYEQIAENQKTQEIISPEVREQIECIKAEAKRVGEAMKLP